MIFSHYLFSWSFPSRARRRSCTRVGSMRVVTFTSAVVMVVFIFAVIVIVSAAVVMLVFAVVVFLDTVVMSVPAMIMCFSGINVNAE